MAMAEKLDKKFYIGTTLADDNQTVIGCLRKAKDDSIVPDDEWCVFLAKDDAFAAVLPEYAECCGALGCDPAQVEALMGMLRRVYAWRAENQDRCKKPDAAGEHLLP
jgi:hypothetical protein